MATWTERSEDLKGLLKLRTEPIAFRRLERAEELDRIRNVVRVTCGRTLIVTYARLSARAWIVRGVFGNDRPIARRGVGLAVPTGGGNKTATAIDDL